MEDDSELDPELAEALRMSMQQDDGAETAAPLSAPAGDVRPVYHALGRLCYAWIASLSQARRKGHLI